MATIKAKTHELQDPALVIAWRDAAIADGWTIEPTYDGVPADRDWWLKRDGFVVSGSARPNTNEYPPRPGQLGGGYFNLCGWCPLGISIDPFPATYDWAAFVKLTRHCPECGADDVGTQRIAFANRACATCAPKLRATLETPGWCD